MVTTTQHSTSVSSSAGTSAQTVLTPSPSLRTCRFALFAGAAVLIASGPAAADLTLRSGAPVAESRCSPSSSLAAPCDVSARRDGIGLSVRPLGSLRANSARSETPFRPTRGNALSLEAAYPVIGSWGLTGYVTGSAASGFGELDGSPLIGTGALRARESFGLGVVKSATWIAGDRLSLTVSQPLGSGANLSATDSPLDAADPGGYAGSRSFGLRTSGREVRTELRYLAPVLKRSQIGLSLINRSNLGDSIPSDERIMTIRFSTEF